MGFFKKNKKVETEKKFEDYQEIHKNFIDIANTTISVSKDLTNHMTSKIDSYLRHISTTAKILTDALIVVDDCGLIHRINPAGEKVFGWEQSELRGKRISNLFQSNTEKTIDFTKFIDTLKLEGCYDGTTSALTTIKGVKKDKTTFIVNISASTYADTDGLLITLLLVRDITEQETTKLKLKENEEFYRTIFEMSFDAIGIIEDFKIIKANHSLLNLFGVKIIQDVDFRVFIRNEYMEQFQLAHSSHINGEDCAFEFELGCKKIDGKPLSLIFGGALVKYEGRNTSLITLKDITFRKNYEDKMRTSLEMKNLLFKTLPHPIFIKDKYGKYSDANDAFASYCGLPKEKIIGAYPYEIFPDHLAKLYSETDDELRDFHVEWLKYKGQLLNQKNGNLINGMFYKNSMILNDTFNGVMGLFVPMQNDQKQLVTLNEKINMAISSILELKFQLETSLIYEQKINVEELLNSETHHLSLLIKNPQITETFGGNKYYINVIATYNDFYKLTCQLAKNEELLKTNIDDSNSQYNIITNNLIKSLVIWKNKNNEK